MPTKGFGAGRRREPRVVNRAEHQIIIDCAAAGVELSRRGYPDYAVICNGEIAGFIEVKPSPDRHLRVAQQAFKRLCQRHNIPFAQWDPSQGLPQFIQKVRLLQGRNKGAD
jgi:hypothetical protein